VVAAWDLRALINAADPRAGQAERHLWLVRVVEWLRWAGPPGAAGAPEDPAPPDAGRVPMPVRRLRHLLDELDGQPRSRDRVHALTSAFWREIDADALYADLGFGARRSFSNELWTRVSEKLLPATPETRDLAALFRLIFEPEDAVWLAAVDRDTAARAAALLGPGPAAMRAVWLEALTILVSNVRATGYSRPLRQRMDPEALQDAPFRQITAAAAALRTATDEGRHAEALHEAAYLRALLSRCRQAATSVLPHLEAYGVSVNIVYDLEQLQARCDRIELLIDCVLAPDPLAEGQRLLLELVNMLADLRSVRTLLAQHYSLLARQVTERSAETGEHYITRDRTEYSDMLRRAAGGGAVIAGTTFVKFAIAALGLSAFWTGAWSGANYAVSFVIVMLLHWTVATKQPAMTAPALAASLPAAAKGGDGPPEAIEAFVDRVAQLIRSQAAGIFGNLALCGPLVWAGQWLARTLRGAPLVGEKDAHYVLHSLTLLGPCVLFAAFTGVLLFLSSLIAGWAENWFVYHRLDSAIAYNPRIVARLGAVRAQRWAAWWRTRVSGLAANVSLGLMLGLAPALLGFVGLPMEVRHVTLSTGQLAAALGALGPQLLQEPVFWWCVAGITATGVLNLTVSFGLAFAVALRSRGIRLKERNQITAAIRRRLLTRPLSFLWPPKVAD
jgi:site-specific recombinase